MEYDHPNMSLNSTGCMFRWARSPTPRGAGGWLALRQRRPASGLFAAPFLLLPVVYYIVTAQARFRHPLEPLRSVLCVYLFQQAELRWDFTVATSRSFTPSANGCPV